VLEGLMTAHMAYLCWKEDQKSFDKSGNI